MIVHCRKLKLVLLCALLVVETCGAYLDIGFLVNGFLVNGFLVNGCAEGRDTLVVKVHSLPGYVDDYINRHGFYARRIERVYKIPACIVLAQGMLESDYGRSRRAREDNNYFGIRGRKGYKKYESIEACYSDYISVLQSERYKHIYRSKDYRIWAQELQKCGYVTDPGYADKLIWIVEKWGLDGLGN